MKTDNIVITIGRQMGSGGSMVGKAIADKFGFQYIDKEFLVKAAEMLHSDQESLEMVDEKTPLWTAWGENIMCDTPYITSEAYHTPTSTQLFNIQTQIMKEAVEQGSCVIIGRCAPHLFRSYPNHISLFLQAEPDVRLERMERELGKVLKDKESGLKYLHKEDKARAKYYHHYTNKRWMDIDEYDFMLDTTPFTDEQIQDIAFHLITTRFPQLNK